MISKAVSISLIRAICATESQPGVWPKAKDSKSASGVTPRALMNASFSFSIDELTISGFCALCQYTQSCLKFRSVFGITSFVKERFPEGEERLLVVKNPRCYHPG